MIAHDVRKEVKQRAANCCERCGAGDRGEPRRLHLHHREYMLGKAWQWSSWFGRDETADDLRLLCATCHTTQHAEDLRHNPSLFVCCGVRRWSAVRFNLKCPDCGGKMRRVHAPMWEPDRMVEVEATEADWAEWDAMAKAAGLPFSVFVAVLMRRAERADQ